MKKLKLKKINIREKFSARKNNRKNIRNGSFSLAITLILIAVVVVVNLLVKEVPAKYREVDLSESKLYTVGSKTEKVLKNLKEEVTLYWVVQSGRESSDIEKLLERYEDGSKYIKVEKKDPAVTPNFTSRYTSEGLADNSIIAVCKDKNKVIAYSDLYEQEVDYTTYSMQTTGFDGEGQITSAIAYVTSEDLPNLYVLQGHNEAAMSETLKSAVQKENVNLKELNLVSQDAVPEDADCLFIFVPSKDISQEEAQKIISYLENGGKALIISNYGEQDMPNFLSVLENYGVKPYEGLVLEGDVNHYGSQNPMYLLPDIQSGDITEELAAQSRYIFAPMAQGIQTLENNRDTLTVTSILKTSDSAYEKTDLQNMETYEKEHGDIAGPFDLGVTIREQLDGGKETQIVYYACGTMFTDQANQMVSDSNYELFTSSLGWMVEHEESVSIPVKSLDSGVLTLSAADVSLWSIFTIGVLPVAFLIGGGMIWFRRRKQ